MPLGEEVAPRPSRIQPALGNVRRGTGLLGLSAPNTPARVKTSGPRGRTLNKSAG